MRLLNFLLIIIILFLATSNANFYNVDSWLGVSFLGLSLFAETLLLQLLLFQYKLNQKLLQFIWVFVTCFTFCLFFVEDFLYTIFSLPKENVPLIFILEIFVCIIEAISLFYILKLKIISKNEPRKINFLRCLLYSFIINSFSTLFSFFVSPILIKWILLMRI